MKHLLFATLTALALMIPTGATSPSITVNEVSLTPQEAWVEEGVSYVTLRGLHRVLDDTELWWNGTVATFAGEGFTLTAQPGAPYIEINDRALYLPQGVSVPNGHTALPVRLVAEALAGSAVWFEDRRQVALTTGIPNPSEASYDPEVLHWLSAIISAESRGESLMGQIAVGNVILNRQSHWRYPNTIYGVIFDTKHGVQFEPVSNGTIYNSPTDSCILAAKLTLEGADVVGDSLYFFAPALSPGTWIRENNQYVTTIGCHQFYREWS